MDLKSMKLSPEEAKEYRSPTALADQPEYPYGLQLTLNDDAIKALGLENLPRVGSEMMIRARVKVCSTNAYETQGGEEEKSVSLQVTDMGIEDEPKESKLYA